MNENFSGRNEGRFRERLGGDVQSSTDEVTDWIRGSGAPWLALVSIGLVIWFVVGQVMGG